MGGPHSNSYDRHDRIQSKARAQIQNLGISRSCGLATEPRPQAGDCRCSRFAAFRPPSNGLPEYPAERRLWLGRLEPGKRMTAPQKIVVVGASLAGLRAVEALRRLGYDGRLVLVGALGLNRVRFLMGYRRMIREGASWDEARAKASAQRG